MITNKINASKIAKERIKYQKTGHKRNVLSPLLCLLGGAGICATITIPVMLYSCKKTTTITTTSYSVYQTIPFISKVNDENVIRISAKGKIPKSCTLSIDPYYETLFEFGGKLSCISSHPTTAGVLFTTDFHDNLTEFTIHVNSILPSGEPSLNYSLPNCIPK